MRIRIITAVPTVEKKKRVCAYARVSTDSRRQEESLENQTATYERLIRSNPEYAFAGVYADQGISGYCENRPQFQKMLERARAGEIDLIAARGSEVSFVEVKTRRNDHYGRPCEAVGAQKIYHIRRTAVHYLQEQEMFYDDVRFHVVEVTLEQIRDAF